jgi:AcrR family transcriptional regulator
MVRVGSRLGYAGASVAEVIAVAGVSRATFYEHFRNRHECFVAAYRSRAEPVEAALGTWAPQPRSDGLRELLTQLLEACESDPATARFLMIDSRALAATLWQRLALQGLAEAALLRCLSERGGSGRGQLQAPAQALLGGVEEVVARRLRAGQSRRLCALLFDLLAWLEGYSVPDREPVGPEHWQALGAALGPPPPLASDPGPPTLRGARAGFGRSESVADRRRRLLAALARLSRRRGYTAMTVADIVAEAGVSRAAFYESFRDKHEAFLAAQVSGLQRSVALCAGAFFGANTWPERVWSGLEAMLNYVATEPDLATVDLVESFAAGPEAVARSHENRMAFLLFLEEGYRQQAHGQRLPSLCSEAIGGAILELIRDRVLEDRAETTRELLPVTSYLAIAPFCGPCWALEFVEAKVAGRATPPVLNR